MSQLVLVHWNDDEAQSRLQELRAAGFDAAHHGKSDNIRASRWRDLPPSAFVFDLSRLPSHSREFAIYVRGHKTLSRVPLVFVDGDPVKVEAIRQQLPDAVYTTWANAPAAIRKAMENVPADPVVPAQMMDRYTGRTVAQKMGIKENSTVSVLDPPPNYLEVLAPLPDRVQVEEAELEQMEATAPVTIWFIHDFGEFQSRLRSMRKVAGRSKLWVAWLKQNAKTKTGINQNLIRESALSVGLVDYKICSINAAWTAMLFAMKK